MRLFIRLEHPTQATESGPVLDQASWVMLDGDGNLRSQGSGASGALADLAGSPALADPDRTVLLIPAEYCLALELTVPGNRVGQIRRALPFALEEYLAGDLDDMHIATGPLVRGRPIAVVAIRRRLLADWLTALRALGLTPGSALVDASLLRSADGTTTVLFEGERALIGGHGHALSIETDSLPAALAAAVAAWEGEQQIMLINGNLSDIDKATLAQGTAARLTFEQTETDVPALHYLAQAHATAPQAVNLLCAEFAPPRPRNAAWQRWRGVAALVGAWIGVALFGIMAKGFWADHRADALAAESEALYRSYFPDDQRIVNVYNQAKARLGADVGGGPGFLVMLGELTRVVTAAAGTEVRSLAFNGDRTELNAELAVPGFERLDGIKSTLASSGWDVEISSAEQQGSQVYARLRMRGSP